MTQPRNTTALPHDDILDIIKGRMDVEEQQALELMSKVNQVYVECGRDELVRDTFRKFLSYVLAKHQNGRRGKGQTMFVTGESGAGKTAAVEYLLANTPAIQPIHTGMGIVRPYISVSQQGPATLATLGNRLLRAAGYPAVRELDRGKVWALLPQELARRKVFLVHIDEVQHVLRSSNDWEDLADALKGMENAPDWPVSFILSGLPEINNLMVFDDQTERRNFSIELPGISAVEERSLIEKIISELCEAAEMDCKELLQSDMPERLAHAANYQFGRIAEVTVHAIHAAFLKNATKLAREHFYEAYLDHSHARGRDSMNPFHVSDWENLKPGYFIIKHEKSK